MNRKILLIFFCMLLFNNAFSADKIIKPYTTPSPSEEALTIKSIPPLFINKSLTLPKPPERNS